jgi:GH15 family glucan-1,4-alpha-glucosidase
MTASHARDDSSPLRDYAAIGDGRTIALIGRDGSVDWLPVPDLYAVPVFAHLVDAEAGGRIELAPRGSYETKRRYIRGTNVLETTFTTASGSVKVTDALVTGVAGRLPWAELARRVDGIEGEVRMRWAVRPGTALGTASPWIQSVGGDAVIRDASVTIGVTGRNHHPSRTRSRQAGDDTLRGGFTTSAGTRHTIVVVATESEPLHLPRAEKVEEGIERTVANWRAWSREFSYDGPWAAAVQRSALALKLLIYSPSGAIAAAATTSLPESPAGGKNWDYRFAWVRDLAYSVDAFLRFGLREEPHAAVSWVLKALKANTTDGMAVFLTLDGAQTEGVHRAAATGWRGIGPVVTGNKASDQLQLGVYADLISIMRAYTADGNLLDGTSSDLLVHLADEACTSWKRKDSGMWELTEAQHHVSSKMGCWQALDAACSLHDMGLVLPPPGTRERWEKNKRLIRRWIDKHGWDERRGTYVMAKGSKALDASVLLHTVSGFDRGERMSRTIDALREELGRGPLLYRYSGMEREEGTFTACAFWLVSALACIGRMDEARELMDELMASVPNDVGIMSEMIDESTGAALGNLPQALSHLALVQAASVIRELS